MRTGILVQSTITEYNASRRFLNRYFSSCCIKSIVEIIMPGDSQLEEHEPLLAKRALCDSLTKSCSASVSLKVNV